MSVDGIKLAQTHIANTNIGTKKRIKRWEYYYVNIPRLRANRPLFTRHLFQPLHPRPDPH